MADINKIGYLGGVVAQIEARLRVLQRRQDAAFDVEAPRRFVGRRTHGRDATVVERHAQTARGCRSNTGKKTTKAKSRRRQQNKRIRSQRTEKKTRFSFEVAIRADCGSTFFSIGD